MAKNLEMSFLLDFYGPMLTDKQRDVVALYYNEDLSLAEIAQHSGITRQGVRDSIKRAEAQMLECEERLGLARRFREISGQLEQIVDLAKDIERWGTRYSVPVEILTKAEQIARIASSIDQ